MRDGVIDIVPDGGTGTFRINGVLFPDTILDLLYAEENPPVILVEDPFALVRNMPVGREATELEAAMLVAYVEN